jgi:hypothetical protein
MRVLASTFRFAVPAGLLLPLVLAAACSTDASPTQPSSSRAASLARSAGAGSACVANPTAVVNDEASLQAAVAAAQPGDVIAIQGMVATSYGAYTTVPHVTFTCATPGSGLRFTPDHVEQMLVYPWGNADVVQGLTLDATGGAYAVYSINADSTRVQFNTITCGDSCGFWVGTTNATVSDNIVVQPHAGSTGLHFQGRRDAANQLVGGIDGTHIERNTVTATTATGLGGFGAIRPRDGSGVVVADNVIAGPWSNGISSVNVSSSSFTKNVISGPFRFGVVVNVSGSDNVAFSAYDTFTANRVTDAGVAGFSLSNACYNVFHGNPSLGTTPLAFVLTATTGANTVDGTAGPSADAGAYDCDGDGQIDPNHVSGQVSRSVVATMSGALTSARAVGAAAAAFSSSAGRGWPVAH